MSDNRAKAPGAPSGVMTADWAAYKRRKPQGVYRFQARALALRQAVERYLDDTKALRVLDLGAADGETLAEFAKAYPDCAGVGVEYAQDIIDAAPQLPPNLRLVQGDVMNLSADLAAEPFDVVYSLAVLEHLPDPAAAVRSAAALLRPGGIFVATCPAPFWDHLAGRFGLVRDEHHEQEMDRAAMTAAVTGAGLELLEYTPFMWVPVGVLPSFGLRIAATASDAADRVVRSARVLNWQFGNQRVVGRKPAA